MILCYQRKELLQVLPMRRKGKLELLDAAVIGGEGEIVGGTTNDELIDYLCFVLCFLHPFIVLCSPFLFFCFLFLPLLCCSLLLYIEFASVAGYGELP